jgi:hypothetical protein
MKGSTDMTIGNLKYAVQLKEDLDKAQDALCFLQKFDCTLYAHNANAEPIPLDVHNANCVYTEMIPLDKELLNTAIDFYRKKIASIKTEVERL